MKLKEARLCCAFAWNPRDVQSNQVLLAAGSIAGAMDDNFSSEAHLEIRKVDLSNTNATDLPVVGRVVMPDRAHRIHWTSHGGTNGMIAAGLVDGTVKVWSADKMLETYDASADAPAGGDFNDDPFGTNAPAAAAPQAAGGGGNADPEAATLCTIAAHQGGVRGLQFNPTRRDLLATGGSDRELCIWSLTNPSEPLKVPSPPKSTHMGEITDVRWNVKFEHIIGTTTSAGTFSLWDLRSLRQTQQISGQQGAATTLAWHPEGLTQVAIARDGANPVVQIWDLKKANAPIKELRGHQNGVVGLAWCHDDSNLLFSAGCDGRTICWNPNSGELVGELAPHNNWVTDVAWCPRVPAIIATSSFDSTLAVHAAQDVSGTTPAGTATVASAVPKWLNRPCSAAFGFGGRIVRVGKAADANGVKSILSIITKAPEVTQDASNFREEVRTSSTNPEWLASKGYADIAAVATSNATGNREPVLGFLGVAPNAVVEELGAVPEGFGTNGNDSAAIEELIARCIACGKLAQAVDLAISAGRFDDAFAVAYLRGGDEVTRVHQAYVKAKSAKARFATYIGAVASKDLTALKTAVQSKTIPWREALAVLTSFLPPQQFASAATEIGSGLEGADASGAASCYICAGAVDATARLWQKERSIDDFIHSTQILESVIKTECRDKVFIDALATYADQLAKAGDYKGALHYAARAAQMGSLEGAVVADLCQSMVAPADRLNIKFPFTPIQIPESRDPVVQKISAMQQPVTRRVDPVVNNNSNQQMGGNMNNPMGGMNQMGPRPSSLTAGNSLPQHPSMPNNSNMMGMMNGMNNQPMMNSNQRAMSMPPPNTTMGGMPPPLQHGGLAPPMGGGNMPPNPNPHNNSGYQPSQFNNNSNNGMPPPQMNRSATPSAPMGGPMGVPPANNNMGGGMMGAPHPGMAPPMNNLAANRPSPMGGALPPNNNGMMPPPPHQGAAPNMPPPTGTYSPMNGMPQQPNQFNNMPPPPQAGGMPPQQPPMSRSGVVPPPQQMGGAPNMPPPPQPQGGMHAGAPMPPPPAPMSAPNPAAAMPPPPQNQQVPPPQQPIHNFAANAGLGAVASPMGLSSSAPQQQPMGSAGGPAPAVPLQLSRPPTSSLVAANFGGPSVNQAGMTNSSSSAVVFTFDTNSIVDPEGRSIATVIVDATNKVKDKRRRESIEKAALELFGRLARNEVSAPCVALLTAYVSVLGTPAAKDAWRKVSDAHFSEIGPYLNLKFL